MPGKVIIRTMRALTDCVPFHFWHSFQTRKLVKVEREPYNGPVIKLPTVDPPQAVSPSQRKLRNQEQKKSGATRDLHRSGFELSGVWSWNRSLDTSPDVVLPCAFFLLFHLVLQDWCTWEFVKCKLKIATRGVGDICQSEFSLKWCRCERLIVKEKQKLML